MNFYKLSKEQRQLLVIRIKDEIESDLKSQINTHILKYFTDDDTYIRKSAYIAFGRIYKENSINRSDIVNQLHSLLKNQDPKVRQTAINAAGEIGIINFNEIEQLIEIGLFDSHHSVRNAVIGSLKKIGEKNPNPAINFAKRFLHHEEQEGRREIGRGLELFGRTHPEEILPLLKELENDNASRVKNMVVHVIGQISYKRNCLEKVIAHLNTWENKKLVEKALNEIVEVHDRYKNFAFYTQEQAIKHIEENCFCDSEEGS
jgi:hypothetical protein